MAEFDELIAQAEARPITGWDFSWLGERMRVDPLPWDFTDIVAERARTSGDLLDLGTGGGEWLASLPSRPARTVATESWAPNVPVARARLEPLGVEVVQVEPAPDNVDQAPGDLAAAQLPFPANAFELVVCRHEAFVASDLARVLRAGGRFVTQQLSPRSESFAALLSVEPPIGEVFQLDRATAQLEEAGLDIVNSAEGEQQILFGDVGAFAWYLNAIPWTLPGFSFERDRDRLRALHQSRRPLEAWLYAFWLDADYR